MTKNEFRLQISKKFKDGTIIVARGDNQEELQNSLDDALFVANVGVPDVPLLYEESQDPDDKLCPVHNVPMTNHQNKSNDGNHWRHDTTDPAYVAGSQYDSVYCFGRPAK